MFAGSCIGVILLVVLLEFLRRVGREYGKLIAPRSKNAARAHHDPAAKTGVSSSVERLSDSGSSTERGNAGNLAGGRVKITRPTLVQQAIRATIHMAQFAVAYFVMLLAMYYNGESPFSLCS